MKPHFDSTQKLNSFQLKLFRGTLQRMMRGEKCREDAVLQILGKKKICGNLPGDVRYRILVSDGGHLYSFAMIAPQQNSLITNVPDLSIIRIDKYHMYSNKEMFEVEKSLWRPILVIFNLTVLVNGGALRSLIGKPVELILQHRSSVSCEPAVSESNDTTMKDISKDRSFNHNTSGADTAMNIAKIVRKHQNGWTIKARAINKTSLNSFARGHYFHVTFRDNTGDIKAVFWSNCCFKYYDMVAINKLYNISEFKVELSNKKFNATAHPFELHSTDKTVLIPCDEEDSSIPVVFCGFMPLNQIFEAERGALVAVIGVCVAVSEINIVAGNYQKETKMQEVSIVDSTNTRVVLTVWGVRAGSFDGSTHPIVVVKSGKIANYNGRRTINVLHSSTLVLNPDISETAELTQWRSSQEFQQMLTDQFVH